ncbi:hypothetical protein TNCV_169801 [Trichonephila clavipes]|nr:hypothetical protein TNCV_169801 [Trichonephila clavipes]
MAGTIITGNTQSYQLLLTNFQTALTNPLNDRCVFLTQLLQDTPLKAEHPGDSQGPSTPLPLPPTSQEGLQLNSCLE